MDPGEQNLLRPVRRIVTSNNERGRSHILLDGVATRTLTVLTELWLTEGSPASNAGNADNAEQSSRLEPPRGGTVFRYFEIAPESQTAHLPEEDRRRLTSEWFAAMNGGHLQVDTSRHPAMHRSETTDYIILLSGAITLVLDEEEVELRPFDVVIQRGTNHAWVNRGTETALLMAVLVDAGARQEG
jgi:mannose-6-phosphate isomerase-like protein (cupin superfamily)